MFIILHSSVAVLLIKDTAPLLQAHFSRHPSQGRLAKPLFPFQSLNSFPTLSFFDFQEVSNAFPQYVQMPFHTNVHLFRPILSNLPQQFFQTTQLHHEPSPITCRLILIGVTAPLLQAHFSRHPSQGRLAHSSRWPNP